MLDSLMNDHVRSHPIAVQVEERENDQSLPGSSTADGGAPGPNYCFGDCGKSQGHLLWQSGRNSTGPHSVCAGFLGDWSHSRESDCAARPKPQNHFIAPINHPLDIWRGERKVIHTDG